MGNTGLGNKLQAPTRIFPQVKAGLWPPPTHPKTPKIKIARKLPLVKLHDSGDYTKAELAEMFGIARSTVGRAIQRAAAAATTTTR